jgi:hypothetical protein
MKTSMTRAIMRSGDVLGKAMMCGGEAEETI